LQAWPGYYHLFFAKFNGDLFSLAQSPILGWPSKFVFAQNWLLYKPKYWGNFINTLLICIFLNLKTWTLPSHLIPIISFLYIACIKELAVEMSSMKMCTFLIVAFFFSGLIQFAHGQAMAPSPMTSDGVGIDQGIAYVLMLVALLVTYLVHWFGDQMCCQQWPSWNH